MIVLLREEDAKSLTHPTRAPYGVDRIAEVREMHGDDLYIALHEGCSPELQVLNEKTFAEWFGKPAIVVSPRDMLLDTIFRKSDPKSYRR
jgi:hypothetical protein